MLGFLGTGGCWGGLHLRGSWLAAKRSTKLCKRHAFSGAGFFCCLATKELWSKIRARCLFLMRWQNRWYHILYCWSNTLCLGVSRAYVRALRCFAPLCSRWKERSDQAPAGSGTAHGRPMLQEHGAAPRHASPFGKPGAEQSPNNQDCIRPSLANYPLTAGKRTTTVTGNSP